MNSIDIEFENLTYHTRNKKQILGSINGRFPGGKLTGILGPSGAGKSTLLNILAGLIHEGVSGSIYINGKLRDNKTFSKISTYITQDDVIQSHLTVNECIQIAADLKLGKNVSATRKQETISAILESMGLEKCIQTQTQHLSGGQRKRVIVALELLNNPPLIFLDEPTTGLDEITLLNCLQLFKKLTYKGRTIICTIHQPSDNVFNLFDHVYFLSRGKCVYRGSTTDIIPLLQEVNLPCPISYNPADYIIELTYENENVTTLLSIRTDIWNRQNRVDFKMNENDKIISYDNNLPPFWYQVSILVKRRFLQVMRNKLQLSIEIGHNVFSAIFVGLIFYKMGNNASTLVSNLFIFYALNIYLLFVHGMAMILLYPFEQKILQREYMNGWYNLEAYFLAFNITSFPTLCLGSIILSLIIYYMTGQITDQIDRIFWFTVVTILCALTSQGFGLSIATIFQPTNGACVGSAIGMCFILLSSYSTGNGMHTTLVMKIVMSLSYLYHSYMAFIVSIFRYRSPAVCNEILCYYSDPNDMLKIMGVNENDYFPSILYLCIFLMLYRIIAYIILKQRVNPDSKLYKIL